jgi:hypothetical protein
MKTSADEFNVDIILRHPSRDPETIARELSITPQSQLDGRQRSQGKHPKRTYVQARLVEGHSVSEYEIALERVVSFIENHAEFWANFLDSNGSAELVFNHSIMSEAENGDKCLEIRFNSVFLALLSNRGIGLKIQAWANN